jgi:hypothetical protein
MQDASRGNKKSPWSFCVGVVRWFHVFQRAVLCRAWPVMVITATVGEAAQLLQLLMGDP